LGLKGSGRPHPPAGRRKRKIEFYAEGKGGAVFDCASSLGEADGKGFKIGS